VRHDGRNDLAVTNKLDVSVMLNDGTGALGPPFHVPSGPSAEGLALGDMNGDGRTDMMVANLGEFDVLLNLGDRSFVRTGYVTSGSNYASALGDLDGDGKPDVVLVNNELDVLLNAGDGTFGPRASYGSASYPPNSVAIGDLNGDGLPDLATTSSDSSTSGASVFFNLGKGRFGPEVKYVFSPWGTFSIAIGDMNSDTLPDLVMGWSSANFAVLLNQGAGVFGPPVAVEVPAPVASFTTLAVGDLNSDGATDVVRSTATGIAIVFARR